MSAGGIEIERVWADEHVLELRVTVSDGRAVFVQDSYVGHGQLDDTVSELRAFGAALPGGTLRVQFGTFGPDMGGGAFRGDLRGLDGGRIRITTRQETGYEDEADGGLSTSSAKLHLTVEPAQFDRFLRELTAVARGDATSARRGTLRH